MVLMMFKYGCNQLWWGFNDVNDDYVGYIYDDEVYSNDVNDDYVANVYDDEVYYNAY